MEITSADVFVTCPGRNFVTVRLNTDADLKGLGDGTLNGRELSVAALLEKHVLPCLIGRDPADIEDIWQFLYRGAYWKRGPAGMSALGAVDMALWDLKGKALDTPVYNLLGGRSREKMLVYGHANGPDLEAALESVAALAEAGYKAIRVQAGVPGVPDSYGVSAPGKKYEPAKKGLPREMVWDSEKYLRFVPELFRRVRGQFGDGLHLLHDVHHRLTPIEAARLARDLEPYRLFWLEDPIDEDNPDGFHLIRQHSTTPLAVGEVYNAIYDYRTLVTEQLIDYVRTPVSHAGGLTHLLKLAHFAGVYGIRTGCHGATDLSPLSMSAALHLGRAINNFGIQEYMHHQQVVGEVFTTDYAFADGYMTIGDAPGLGVEFDAAAAERYPYEPAALPVNRLTDGTVTNW